MIKQEEKLVSVKKSMTFFPHSFASSAFSLITLHETKNIVRDNLTMNES